MKKYISIGILLLLASGCATDSITFNANQKATISLVSLSDPSGEGQILGELPSTIEVDKLEGKVVKIKAEGFIPQFWIAKDFVANSTKVNIALTPVDDGAAGKGGGSGKGGSSNLPFRILMKGFTAISRGDYQLGREFAGKLEEIDPTLAAPHLLTGIAYFNEGKKVDAKNAFEKALALDPEDLEIKKMIDALR